jgi:tetratricopeptide (TPR) repeat protein
MKGKRSQPKASTEQPACSTLDTLGVSVHWLKTGLMNEVCQAGLNESSKIYEIENLDGPPGVIRTKGVNVTSRTEDKIGAAYVHCLHGQDNVGEASSMLSYTWAYTIGDIVDTLDAYCTTKNLHPKRTYIWICCLCVNQHRVAEAKKSGILAPTETFFEEFGVRVARIGHILAMMAPWNEPLYLKRIWCIFEIYTANEKGCDVTIVMPPDQKKQVKEDIVGELYKALDKTKIEDAKASVEQDRLAILDKVQSGPGYKVLNHRVNNFLRSWLADTILEAVEQARPNDESADRERDLRYARLCNQVGLLLDSNGEHGKFLELLGKTLAIRESVYGTEHPKTANTHCNIGSVLYTKGDCNGALVEYRKALVIQESVFGTEHRHTARSHLNIGEVLYSNGDYDGDLVEYRKSLAINKSVFGREDQDAANTYNNIGEVLYKKGDYEGALVEYRKSLAINKSIFGTEDQNAAITYNNIGEVLCSNGDYDVALVEYRKALAIRESVLGTEHPTTPFTYNNIGEVLYKKGDYDGALVSLL